MARSNYKVAFVERGYEHHWREYWVTGGELSAATKKAHSEGRLGRTEIIPANTEVEAIRRVEEMHPDCVVMREGTGRIGRA
jgi:hypothetical protein